MIEELKSMPKKEDYTKALKKKADEHYSSMAKGFTAVTPTNYELEEEKRDSQLYFPSFCLKLKDIPEAKEWKVGEKYKLEVYVEQKGLRDRGDDAMQSEVDFNILGVKAIKDGK
jgi:hypothetical protein